MSLAPAQPWCRTKRELRRADTDFNLYRPLPDDLEDMLRDNARTRREAEAPRRRRSRHPASR